MMRSDSSCEEQSVQIPVPADTVTLEGNLSIPDGATGIVLFAHGSGSSRHSSRNRFVAQEVQRAGIATLLFDLLTAQEEASEAATGHLRFDIPFLAQRLHWAMEWIESNPSTAALHPGFFGASTGGAAALVAASQMGSMVYAVVSRGGRPDLAGPALSHVRAPTLLIVGREDRVVVSLNEEALRQLNAEKRIELVPDATHLFEEPGALEAVACLACDWFKLHLA